MLIHGVSRIFAHKKTIKQFLQPMIEQVYVCVCVDVPLFLGQFFRATIFLCRFFFQFTDAFLVDFTNEKQFLRACLYGAELARVPGLARFAEILPPQKIP